MTRPDVLQVLADYHRRVAVAGRNDWADLLVRLKTRQAVPGVPPVAHRVPVTPVELVPLVGDLCVHLGPARRPRLVEVAAVDGRFARVIVDGEGEWVACSDLQPVVRS